MQEKIGKVFHKLMINVFFKKTLEKKTNDFLIKWQKSYKKGQNLDNQTENFMLKLENTMNITYMRLIKKISFLTKPLSVGFMFNRRIKVINVPVVLWQINPLF